jgi:hypothetical protein
MNTFHPRALRTSLLGSLESIGLPFWQATGASVGSGAARAIGGRSIGFILKPIRALARKRGSRSLGGTYHREPVEPRSAVMQRPV